MVLMVTVSISETYDLSTKVNKMTLIGIHTPTKELIQKTYPGLCMNFKYFQVKSVDVALATAQTLPLGVDQIGLDQTKIHPQDMMNPILYKATSNDSWSVLEARIMGYVNQSTGGVDGLHTELNGNMAFTDKDNLTPIADEHNVYYSLLSNRDGFKMAGVREGVRMKGLVPLVFDKWFTHGENVGYLAGAQEDVAYGIEQSSSGNYQRGGIKARGMRGAPHRMPRINTTYLTGIGASDGAEGGQWAHNGMGDGSPTNIQIQMPEIPPVMLGAIILPPATADNGIIYYRMVTRAWIEFTDARPITEITSFAQMDSLYSGYVYHSDYNEQAKVMDATTDMVDVKNADIEKIMEGR